MFTITLKRVPLGLHRRLEACARQNHRSLKREIVSILASAVGSPPTPATARKWLGEARRLRAGVKFRLTDKFLREAKGAGRDR